MHKIMSITISIFFLLVVILSACASKQVATEVPRAEPREAMPASSAKPAWEEDWEATLRAARKDGEVLVYTLYGVEWRQPMAEVMAKRYGITFDFLTGRAEEILARLLREQQNKVYQADVAIFISAVNFLSIVQPAGILQPFEKILILPEVVDPKAWRGGKLRWFDPDTKTLLVHREQVSPPILVNTESVMPQEMRAWDDLLNPKWKGKMVLNDPTASGSGRTMTSMLAYAIKDWDFINKLLKQEPVIQRDYRLMTEWVARGKYAILIGPRKEEAYEFMKAGAPIQFVVFQDGSVTSFGGTGTVAVPKGALHPEAAKVFLNFFLSKEGQTLNAKVGGYPSLRVDVPTDFLDPATVVQPGVKYFASDDMDYLQKAPEIDRKMAQLIAPSKK